MAFILEKVVPWGRRLSEYREMFALSETELRNCRIASFGDGPASFNAETTRLGGRVVSIDPIYGFSAAEIRRRIGETRSVVLEQTRKNRDNYRWDRIPDLRALEALRMSAMELFLADFESGLAERRYIAGELPSPLPFADREFDLGLSSHFLLLYAELGWEFHRAALSEMLRVCREVRIFTVRDLSNRETGLTERIIDHYSAGFQVRLVETGYEFQKGATRMLVLHRREEPVTAP